MPDGHYAHDVKADGNCFYRALARCLADDPVIVAALRLQPGMRGVQRLRRTVAELMQHDPAVRGWLQQLFELVALCPKLEEDFHLLERNGQGELDVMACCDAVREAGTWASEVEVRILQRLLDPFGVAVLTVDAPDVGSMQASCDLEAQILAQTGATPHPRCLVLIHVADSHYMYLSLNGQRVVATRALHDYVETFLEEMEEEEGEEEGEEEEEEGEDENDTAGPTGSQEVTVELVQA